jgi:hypothetical protein
VLCTFCFVDAHENLCVECQEGEATLPDPRDPPIECGVAVLCRPCAVAAYADEIQTATETLSEMVDALRKIDAKAADEANPFVT